MKYLLKVLNLNLIFVFLILLILPEIEPKLKQQMIDEPWHTRSDSFYFVGNNLIMHNKAIYNYGPLNS